MRYALLGSSAFFGMMAGVSLAVPIAVTNHSFEDPGSGVPGWSNTGGSYRVAYTPFPVTFDSVPDGAQVVGLGDYGARIYQTTEAVLKPGRVYNLSAYFGERNDTYQPRMIMTLLPESEIADYVSDPFGGGTDHLSFVQVEPEDIASKEFKQFSLTFDTNAPANAAMVSQYANQKLVVTMFVAGNGEVDADKVEFNYIPAGPSQWQSNASGDWNDETKWSEGIPNGVDQPANFLNAITAPQTIYTNTAVTVGSMTFDNANSYQITGQGSLTLQATSGSSAVNVQQGSHKLNLPTYFASDTSLNVSGGATLTLADPVVIRANKTVTRNGNVIIQAPLTIESNGVLNIASGPTAVIFGAPSLASGAKVNVQSNAISIDYRGQSSPASTVLSQLVSGRNGGAWDGAGISTSSATATTGLGWVDSPASQSILVKYTYNGDTNLDGSVNSNDFNAFVAAYGATSGAVWAQGDFDYDGKISTKDFNALAGNFGQTLPAPNLGSVVPEPGSAMLLTLGAGLLCRSRRVNRIG